MWAIDILVYVCSACISRVFTLLLRAYTREIYAVKKSVTFPVWISMVIFTQLRMFCDFVSNELLKTVLTFRVDLVLLHDSDSISLRLWKSFAIIVVCGLWSCLSLAVCCRRFCDFSVSNDFVSCLCFFCDWIFFSWLFLWAVGSSFSEIQWFEYTPIYEFISSCALWQ